MGGNSADTVSCLEYVEGWKNLESIQSFESRKIIVRSRDLFLLILGQTRFESTKLACFRFELHIQGLLLALGVSSREVHNDCGY